MSNSDSEPDMVCKGNALPFNRRIFVGSALSASVGLHGFEPTESGRKTADSRSLLISTLPTLVGAAQRARRVYISYSTVDESDGVILAKRNGDSRVTYVGPRSNGEARWVSKILIHSAGGTRVLWGTPQFRRIDRFDVDGSRSFSFTWDPDNQTVAINYVAGGNIYTKRHRFSDADWESIAAIREPLRNTRFVSTSLVPNPLSPSQRDTNKGTLEMRIPVLRNGVPIPNATVIFDARLDGEKRSFHASYDSGEGIYRAQVSVAQDTKGGASQTIKKAALKSVGQACQFLGGLSASGGFRATCFAIAGLVQLRTQNAATAVAAEAACEVFFKSLSIACTPPSRRAFEDATDNVESASLYVSKTGKVKANVFVPDEPLGERELSGEGYKTVSFAVAKTYAWPKSDISNELVVSDVRTHIGNGKFGGPENTEVRLPDYSLRKQLTFRVSKKHIQIANAKVVLLMKTAGIQRHPLIIVNGRKITPAGVVGQEYSCSFPSELLRVGSNKIIFVAVALPDDPDDVDDFEFWDVRLRLW